MTDESRSHVAPRPEPERISALINRINTGDVKLPSFQRPQVWKQTQVIDLLDSIRNGYPIGSLLFWLTYVELASERNVGGFALPNTPDKYPRNYVLDGQQRVTALYAVLTRSPQTLDSPFKVVYDLEERAFVPFDPEGPISHLPLNILYSTREFLEFQERLRTEGSQEALLNEAQDLWETFHNYVIPIVTVQETPITTVGIIFERINSRGTRLTLFDLMVAATWQTTDGEEFNLREKVDSVREHLEEKDFGGVEDVSILRALSVVTSGSAKKDTILGLRELGRETLNVSIERARSSLAKAVDFLVTEVAVKSSDFLPYERQLILLTYLMSKKNSVTRDEFLILRKWFWRSSFSERYRSGGEGLFDDDMQTAVRSLEDPSLLRRFGSVPGGDFFTSSQFRKGAAAGQAFAALLGSRSPRNITNGASIDVGASLSQYNRKEFHHIFPQAYLKSEGVDRALINSLSNICLLTASENKKIGSTRPSEYVSNLKDELGDSFEDIMLSNLIPPECIDLLLADDFSGFLETRGEFLGSVIADEVK